MKARLLNKVVLDLCAVTAHLAELVTQILKANAVAWIYVHPGHLPSVTHPHPYTHFPLLLLKVKIPKRD